MKNRGKMSVRAEVVFREVAAHFSEADWKLLDEEQKKSYIDVMKDVHQYLVSLGCTIVNSHVFTRIRTEEEDLQGHQDARRENRYNNSSMSPRTVTPDILLVIKKEEEAYDWKPCSSVKSELENTAASPVITSVFSIKEEPSPLDVDAEESRINQEKTNARDCNVKRIHVGNHEMDIEMATGRGMAEIKRRTEHETARSEGASKSLIPRNTLEMLKTGSTQKPVADFLSDLNQEQRQTIRSFMRVLLNVIDQEPILPQFISPLLPPQLHSPQLLPVQPHPIQPLPVQTNSIHLNSIKLPVPPPSVQPNTVQLRCLPPHSVLSQSFHPKSKQLQTVQPHSVQLQSLPSHSLQPRSVQPQYIRPLSNQTQSIQPHSGQAHSIQLHAAKQQSASPLSVLPQCFLPQSALSPAICKTSYLQGSTTALKAPLIVDPTLPERFASVTVDKQHLRRLLMAADGRVKKHAAFLLNGLIKLLFKKEELARSDGLGLRGKKSNSLDQVKVDAMREFLHSKCLERKWNHLDGNRFTRIITNKISNARRDLKQGNKCHLDSKAKPQAAYRSEKMLHCSSSGAGPATPPLQALSCNQGKAERTLSKGDSF
ncbi:uncharacterized protein [Ambystoma mexicanum]|uniref:uncharacterized protein isoform X5 n=1 Tax=Ambystoma mexicanum TaxID=8296 RepID=UPI0037E792B2